MWTRIEVYRNLRQDSRSSHYWEENIQKDTCCPGGDWQKFKATTRLEKVWTKIGKAAQKREKQDRAVEKPKTRQRSKVGRHLLRWSGCWRIQRNHEQCAEKIRSFDEGDYALQKRDKVKRELIEPASGNWKASAWAPNDSKNKVCMYRGSAWVHETKSGIISTERSWRSQCRPSIYFDDPSKNWFTSLFQCLKRWRFRMQKQQWTRTGRNLRQFRSGSWEKSRARRRLFWKYKETERKSTLLHWWTFVMSRMQCKNQTFRSTRVESCSEGTL